MYSHPCHWSCDCVKLWFDYSSIVFSPLGNGSCFLNVSCVHCHVVVDANWVADMSVQLLCKILMRYFEISIYTIFLSCIAFARGITATVPPQLQFAAPACAQRCLLETIEQDFSPFCFEPITLDCLCSVYGISGLVIGESMTETNSCYCRWLITIDRRI